MGSTTTTNSPNAATIAYNTRGVKSQTTNEALTLPEVVGIIQRPQTALIQLYSAIRDTARLHYNETDESRKTQLKGTLSESKKHLPFFIPSGYKSHGHGNDNITLNGTVQLDIDFHSTGGDVTARQQKHFIKLIAEKALPFIQLAATSPTNYGLKVWINTDLPSDTTAELYTFAQKQIIDVLAQILSLETSCFDLVSIGKACYQPFDPTPYFNLNASKFKVNVLRYNEEKEAKNEKEALRRASMKGLEYDGSNVTAAAQYLIDNQINVTDGYNSYVSIIGACINSFDAETAENVARQLSMISAKFNEKHFAATFKSLSKSKTPDNAATAGTLIYHALQNGFVLSKTPTRATIESLDIHTVTPNLALLIIDRPNALQRIDAEKGRKIVVCEDSFMDTAEGELTGENITFCSYKDLSRLTVRGVENANIYVLGASNLTRKNYINTANEIEKLAKNNHITFFSDTPVFLSIASKTVTVTKYANNSKVIISDSPSATFVELIRKENEAQYLETSESIAKQLDNAQRVKRSELYAADHTKTLFVLYDSNVQLLPEAFAQFENVVFVAHSEKKKFVSVKNFAASLDKLENDALQFVDNEVFRANIEKVLFQTVKAKALPIRYNRDGKCFERCPNLRTMLETENEVKILVADVAQLEKRITSTKVETFVVSEETKTINQDIKQAKKDLAAEKKAEYVEFLESVASSDVKTPEDYHKLANKLDMSRGGAMAHNRLTTLLSVNTAFSTCFEAVENYTGWTRTKGRFFAANVLETDTKQGKALQAFKTATNGNKYTKGDLLLIASEHLKMIQGNEAEMWRQLKRVCVISSERHGKKRTTFYECIFFE